MVLGFQFSNDGYFICCHSNFTQMSTNVPVIPVLTEQRVLTKLTVLLVTAKLDIRESVV